MSVAHPVAEATLDASKRRRRLLVAWQHPTTRAIDLVGCLDVPVDTEGPYRFAYFHQARAVPGFQPFVEMADLEATYESSALFSLFENRMTPRRRADYPDVAASVGLAGDADPFEVLARTSGRRATDTVEVSAEPTVDPATGTLHVNFLARGLRHIDLVGSVIDELGSGDRLRVLCDVQNPVDDLALTLADHQTRTVGWVPRYLTPIVRRSAEVFGWKQVDIRVEHVGDPAGPPHLRLLCHLQTKWEAGAEVFSDPSYGLAGEPTVASLAGGSSPT